ncbi:endochitinase A1-like [Cyprinodon tularosa]|uniref:endochitinase A1-like n=1 Tax=Cyprinodon tularosa TaxID=77115 RepID=UPI0018E2723F|nr:endochitinase A1-like [Cyprinodon tularosa]
MRAEIHLVICVLVVFTGSPQTGGQSHALPAASIASSSPAPTETPPPPEGTEPTITEVPQRTQHVAGRNETFSDPTVPSSTERMIERETSADAGHLHVSSSTKATSQSTNTTPSLSAAAVNLSSTPTALSSTSHQATGHIDLLTSKTVSTVSSPTVQTAREESSTSLTSTMQPQSAVTTHTTALSQTLAFVLAPVGPTHREFPSELNIGDEDLKGSHHGSSSPLDPLLASLLSVFIVATAVVFAVLFLKFRKRMNNPEFHRLQDLPMDDLMEDTPLSPYAH